MIFKPEQARMFIGLPLLFLCLFINKPFHIDDTLFLTMADLMPWSFVGTGGGEAYFLGEYYPHLNPFESTHPLLIPWILKLLDALQGSGKPAFWKFHLFFLIFPSLLLYFNAQMLQVLDKDRRWLLLLGFSPLLFVNATNLMTDIAMVAFWCGTLSGTVLALERKVPRYAIQAAVCLGLALLTSYQSVALFPLIGVLLLVRRAPFKLWFLILGSPLFVLIAYLLVVFSFTGFFPFLASGIEINIASEVGSGLNLEKILHKLVATFDFLGLGLVFFTPMLWLSYKGKQRTLWIAVSFVCFLVTAMIFTQTSILNQGYSLGGKLLVSLLVSTGSYWCVWALIQLNTGLWFVRSEPKKAGFLIVGACLFLGVAFYNVVLMPYGTARYVLPALPGALLLVALRFPGSLPAWVTGVVCICSLGASLVMSAVDYRHAQADWIIFKAAKEEAAPNQTIRFSDDAGMVRYFKNQGGVYVDQHTQSIEADQLLLVTRGMIQPELMTQTRLIKEIEVPSLWGLTLFHTQSKAGFYRSLDGLLPVSRSSWVKKAWLYRVKWFENHLNQVEAWNLPNANYFRRAAAEFPERGTQHGLFMHPDATIAYPWSFQEPKLVKGVVCPLPTAWDKEGDGVMCTVGVQVGEERRTVWSREINPKQNPQDQAGASFQVEVPANASAIWFSVGPGSKGDYRHDSVLWFDLAILPAQK